NLSVIISFLMVFPVIYTNVRDGIRSMDPRLAEMAEVFEIPVLLRVRYIYASQVLPFFRAGCSLALGLCWKSGIAAEVIGLPENTIGENLYNAKIYLNTPDLFAWTLVIVAVSVLFEKVFLKLIDLAAKRTGRMGWKK
ncbi:MAG TPA: ABC transporter permease subunit, partial [Candidatus Mediterraneibacter excrementigallinarum]|nr:ABC transporter permease subunit [Candidatus Mediterraneibacter excrementigallinarum]